MSFLLKSMSLCMLHTKLCCNIMHSYEKYVSLMIYASCEKKRHFVLIPWKEISQNELPFPYYPLFALLKVSAWPPLIF